MRRPRNGPAEIARLQLRHLGHQMCPAGERPALLRGPGAELAAAVPAGEIGVRLLGAHRLGRAQNHDLLLELAPVEVEAHLGIAEDLPSLAALQVGVEDEAPLVEALEED